MGTYDRSLQWRMMQQRHPHSSLAANPYFASGYSALGTTAGGERRSAGLLCPTSSTTSGAHETTPAMAASGNYYASAGDDRATPLKRQRVTKHSPRATGLPSSGGPQRASALASYLPSSTSSAESYNHNSHSTSQSGYSQPATDGYGATTSAGPEFPNDAWFPPRSSGAGTGLTVNTSNSYNETGSSGPPTSSGLSRQTSLASPTTMFGMENLMADYESGFYSLWNGSNSSGVMGYDGGSTPPDARPSSNQSVYMPEEELKMDYPQLPDLNQGDLDYIYGTMEPRASESHADRGAYASSSSLDRKRDRGSDLGDGKLGSGLLSPTQTSLLSPLPPSGFRNLARTTTIETKRPAPPRSQGGASSSYHGDATGSAHVVSTPLTTSSAVAASRRQPQQLSSSSGSTTPGAKRPRSRQCDFPGCENRARSHQKCKKHGGAHQCVYEGCQKNSQSRGLCIAHGGGSRCKIDGCTRASQSKGRCKSHGGGEYCAVEGCRKKAHLKHLCRTHGGGVRCKDPKCMKWAQRKGWCMAHAKEVLGT